MHFFLLVSSGVNKKDLFTKSMSAIFTPRYASNGDELKHPLKQGQFFSLN